MTKEQLRTHIGFASITGKRSSNQDFVGAYLAKNNELALKGIVTAIADGVGDSPGGRVAAELAVRGFMQGYYDLPETLGVEKAAGQAVSAINRWLVAQNFHSNSQSAVTTFSALILRNRQFHIVHVGDTRIYRLRDKHFSLLTKDHTRDHPDLRHVLIRGVGLDEGLRVDYSVDYLQLHDRFVLCSDGIHGVLNDKRIQTLMAERSAPEEGAQRLVQSALDAGSKDNISAVVVDIVGLPTAEHTVLETAFEALPILDLPKVEDTVDGFRLEKVLSDGRYSRLFIAEDTATQEKVVVKFPHPRVTSDKAFRRAFVREAWIAARVRSPWIIQVNELAPGRQTRLYSVMPFYQGQTLEQYLLRKSKITLKAGINIGLKLSKAVYTLNRQQIIHRDIKPDNVLLENDNGLRLLDLGVASLPGFSEFPEEAIPGTPSYMAPELFQGQHGDERSDVFALGVTLYRMFSGGHYPYGEIEPFTHPRFNKRIPLAHYRPDLPAWLDQILRRATLVDKEGRFADAMELAFELENGLARGASILPEKQPLYHRNPLLVWKIISAILFLALIISHW